MRTLWMAVVIVAATAVGSAQQDAKAFLKQVQQKYRNAKSWEISIDITAELNFGGNSQKQQSSSTIAMQRPNRVAAKVGASGFSPAREVYSDGKTVFVYVPSAKQYMSSSLRRPNLTGANAGLLGEAGHADGHRRARLRPAGSRMPRFSFAARRPSRANRRELWRSPTHRATLRST
jgi:outer membrane lipoprotein-sorting protein